MFFSLLLARQSKRLMIAADVHSPHLPFFLGKLNHVTLTHTLRMWKAHQGEKKKHTTLHKMTKII